MDYRKPQETVNMARLPTEIQKMYPSNKSDTFPHKPTCSVILKLFIFTSLITVHFPARATDLTVVQSIEVGSAAH